MPLERPVDPKLMAAVDAALAGKPAKRARTGPSDFIQVTHKQGEPPKKEWFLWNPAEEVEESYFIYEYARTAPWIENAFRKCKRGETPPLGVKWGFKPDGTWYFQSDKDSDFHGLDLELPEGFPAKPYSETKQGKASRSQKNSRTEYHEPIFEVSPSEIQSAGLPQDTGDVAACFWIKWEAQDVDIVGSFKAWLKGQVRDKGLKPHRLRKKRQNSSILFGSLLFDLGVFRVLIHYDYTPHKLVELLEKNGRKDYPVQNIYRSFDRAGFALEKYFAARDIPRLAVVMAERRKHRKRRKANKAT